MFSTLVCLHGWGGSKESFTELRAALKGSDLRIVTPDLPGFGGQPEPDRPWTVADYATWVAQYIRKNVHEPYALLGHSHGGRIAIKLAAQLPQSQSQSLLPAPNHLYLCAPAGIYHPRHLKRTIGLVLAKTGDIVLSVPSVRAVRPHARKLLYKLLGVHDYEQASETMRKTLMNITQEDLRPLLPHIRIPTTIFWGEEDTMTPLSDGNLMHEQIAGSELHTYPGVRHRVHRDRAGDIARHIQSDLRGKPRN